MTSSLAEMNVPRSGDKTKGKVHGGQRCFKNIMKELPINAATVYYFDNLLMWGPIISTVTKYKAVKGNMDTKISSRLWTPGQLLQ